VLSKNTIKRITRLGQKKYRTADGLFVAEGVKVIHELLNSSLELEKLFSVEEGIFEHPKCDLITAKELAIQVI